MNVRMLTVKQPWAAAIIFGGKDIENRSWPTTYRGPLIIHAGKGVDREAFADLERLGVELTPDQLRGGVILGAVRLVDCHQEGASPWSIRGHWHWHLDRALPADRLIECRGKLGLHSPPPGWQAAFARLRTGQTGGAGAPSATDRPGTAR